jgi:hypothetical protein
MATSSTQQLLHAWQAFELAVPVFHAAALYFTSPPGCRKSDLWRQAWFWPLAGGARTLVFQLLAWVGRDTHSRTTPDACGMPGLQP